MITIYPDKDYIYTIAFARQNGKALFLKALQEAIIISKKENRPVELNLEMKKVYVRVKQD